MNQRILLLVALWTALAASSALRGASDHPTSQAARPARSTAQLLEAFKTAKDSSTQYDAARDLIALADPGPVIPEMLPLLGDESRRTRCTAGWVLASLGDARGFDVLLRELKDTAPRPVQPGGIPRGDGRPNVQGQITSDRYYAAMLLGELKDVRAVPALIDLLKDPTLYYQAAISLGKIGSKDAILPLKNLAENKDPARRIWADYALAQLGEAHGLDSLLRTLTGGAPPQRARAAELLANFRDSRVLPALVAALDDNEVEVRRRAIIGLANFRDSRVLPALVAALDDNEVEVRRRAIIGLTILGDPAAIPALEKLSKDPTPVMQGTTRTIGDEATDAIHRLRPPSR